MTQIISPDIPGKERLLKNFFHVIGVYGAIWIIFHLICVFFFGFIVGSALLVGIFLGIGNIWSMIIDVPLGTIQRHVPSKRMLSFANGCMVVAAILFLYLIRTNVDEGFTFEGSIIEVTKNFLSNIVNFSLLLMIGILYGTIKEVYDITTISYLLNHSEASEYDTGLSKMSINSGVGSVVGILVSIGLLSFRTDSVELIIFVLIFLIVCVWVFIETYFDNEQETFHMSDVHDLHIVEKIKNGEKNTVTWAQKTVSTTDFQAMKNGLHYIIVKPKEIASSIDWGSILDKTKQEYRMLLKLIFSRQTLVPILLWTTGSIFLFGCWDTIVTTFFIDYLDGVLESSGLQNIIRSGFILIGILAIPAYGLQNFWIKKSDAYTKVTIIILGLFLSAIALFGLAFAGSSESLIGLVMVMVFGMTNSTGYAAGYPMSQSIFADEYNKAYAQVTQSTVINADVSAAPLKILNNAANALGLIFGGFLISLIGFSGMFIVYGGAVLFWGIVSVRKKKAWDLG